MFCLTVLLVLGIGGATVANDDWPQWRGPNRDGVWSESRIVDDLESDEIEVLWRQPISAGYCSPTVADDRVFVMDRIERPEQKERIHCFDAKLGTKLWTYEYPCVYAGVGYTAGPRASVTIEGSRAIAIGTMGHLHCLDVGDGTVLWSHDLNEELDILTDKGDTNRMPIWGIAAAPLVVDDLVIVHPGAREGASVVAYDLRSGEEEWRALDDRAQYSAPIMIEQAGRQVMVIWTADSVAGLNPRTGRVHWRFPFAPSRMPIGVATPVVDGDRLFVTSFYDGALMLKLNQDALTVEKLWAIRGASETRTKAIHSIISTPLMRDGYIYGVDSYGEFRCLDATTGERIWEDQTAVPKGRWSTIHFVTRGEQVWMFTERGDLILAELSPSGFKEHSRRHLIDPTTEQLRQRNGVTWSHPAFANRCVFVRNDNELVCVSLKD